MVLSADYRPKHLLDVALSVSSELNPQERLDWLRLIRSENVGPITFHHLLQRYGSAGAALKALPDLARRGGGRREVKICPRGDAEREMTTVARLGARLVAWGEADYPPNLTALEDAPPLLTMLGHGSLLARPVVALVGARNASATGMRLARSLAVELGRAGVVVASGLARGIDGAAHQGALETGTIAIVGGGIDVVYPEDNRTLHEQIASCGLLIAESPVGTVPRAQHFPRRNRIISGVSLGVVVIEAALRSGSLITARFAAEQGRDVYAVPGSPLDPRCRGTNDLIRHGAVLVENAEDILAELRNATQDALREPPRRRHFGDTPSAAGLDEDQLRSARKCLVELLSPTPIAVDELIRISGLPPAIVLTVLLELELAGRLDRHPGSQVSLISSGC